MRTDLTPEALAAWATEADLRIRQGTPLADMPYLSARQVRALIAALTEERARVASLETWQHIANERITNTDAERDAAEARLAAVRALHTPVESHFYGLGCPICGMPMATFGIRNPAPTYPCATVRALDGTP